VYPQGHIPDHQGAKGFREEGRVVSQFAPASRPSGFAADRLIRHNLVVAVGTVAAGGLGFAFQALVAHRLAPGDYGAVFALVTLLTLIGLPASALQLVMARETSQDRAIGHVVSSAALLRLGNRSLLLFGTVVALLFAIASPLVAPFFNVPTGLMLAAVICIPPTLALPMILGELQGQQRFLSLSTLSVGQASLKLIGALLLGVFFGPVGILAGLAVASVAAYAAGLYLVRRKLAIRVNSQWIRPVFRYLTLVLTSTVALAILLSADVLLVKHFFSAREAGEYAAVAALGRAIFWAAAGVGAVLFPKVIYSERQGKSGSHIVVWSLGLVVVGSVAGLVILSVASKFVLSAFAGYAYARGSAYLVWYGIGMTLLGCASVLIATHQSRARSAFLAVLVPIALLEPALIMGFHHSLAQVIAVLNVTMLALVLGLSGLLLLGKQGQVPTEMKLLVRAVPMAEMNL
jgi:O-antigen/teichoic acid export membrane protein